MSKTEVRFKNVFPSDLGENPKIQFYEIKLYFFCAWIFGNVFLKILKF